MQTYLVKLFNAESRYTWIQAETPLAAAEKLSGQKLKDRPPGEVVALVQINTNYLVTATPFYADEVRQSEAVGQRASEERRWLEGVGIASVREERDRLLKDIEDFEVGEMRVQCIIDGVWSDVTALRLEALNLRLASLNEVIDSYEQRSIGEG